MAQTYASMQLQEEQPHHCSGCAFGGEILVYSGQSSHPKRIFYICSKGQDDCEILRTRVDLDRILYKLYPAFGSMIIDPDRQFLIMPREELKSALEHKNQPKEKAKSESPILHVCAGHLDD